jgi:hypothetical protein
MNDNLFNWMSDYRKRPVLKNIKLGNFSFAVIRWGNDRISRQSCNLAESHEWALEWSQRERFVPYWDWIVLMSDPTFSMSWWLFVNCKN